MIFWIWCIICLPCLVINIYCAAVSEEMWDILIYPRLNRYWARCDIRGRMATFMNWMYTIWFFPAVALYFALFALCSLYGLAVYGIAEAKSKRKGEKK